MKMHGLLSFLFVCLVFGSFSAQAGDLTKWSNFEKGKHPDYLDKIPSTESDIIWCVWHEGLVHENLQPDSFRQQCAPMHKSTTSKNRVLRATNNEISTILARMDQYFGLKQNGGYKMLFKQLRWVLDHEGRREEVLKLLDAGDFNKIRSIYYEEQSHHAHVEYMAAAASNKTLREMINQM